MGDFYCTMGRGMDSFCCTELQQLKAKLHGGVEGKLFFDLPEDHGHPILLRTAERVFVNAFHGKQILNKCNKAAAAFHIQRLLSEQISWTDVTKTWRLYHPGAPDDPLPFRINVRVTGHWRKILQPIRIARSFSQRFSKSLKLFKSCLKNPLVLIDLHISDEHITAGMALTLRSQALRGPSHGLRSTTAYAMVMCLHKFSEDAVTDQSIVLDPMCGKGSILNELRNCIILGSDNDPMQLKFAKENVKRANLILTDARYLPIKSKSVDHILCDIPFGIQYSTQSELEHLIPSVINEMKRIIKSKGVVVLLISIEQFTILDNIIKKDWTWKHSFQISLGLLDALICVYVSD